MRAAFPVDSMCKVLRASRSGFYEWQQRLPKTVDPAEQRLKDAMQRIFRESRSTYGFRSIKMGLAKKGFHIGKKCIRRLIKGMGLVAMSLRPNPYAALKTSGESMVCKNRLSRNFTVKRPDRVWTGDIIYI